MWTIFIVQRSRYGKNAVVQSLAVPSDPLCLRCGYNLRGLDAEKVCPECGLGVARSLDPRSEFHRGRPIWLNRLAAGARLLLTTQIGVLVLLFSFIFASPYLERLLSTWAIIAILGLFAVMHCVALLLLTWPENRFERRQLGNRLRILLRVWAWNAPMIVLLMVAAKWFHTVDWIYAFAGAAFLLAPCWALTFLYLCRLALRALDPGLAEHCAIVGCGMAIAIAGPFGYALEQEFGHVDNMVMLTIFFGILIAIFLFVIWSTYLLILFTIAFGKAAVLARKSWEEADAAAATE
jgi:hypothetical protein